MQEVNVIWWYKLPSRNLAKKPSNFVRKNSGQIMLSDHLLITEACVWYESALWKKKGCPKRSSMPRNAGSNVLQFPAYFFPVYFSSQRKIWMNTRNFFPFFYYVRKKRKTNTSRNSESSHEFISNFRTSSLIEKYPSIKISNMNSKEFLPSIPMGTLFRPVS